MQAPWWWSKTETCRSDIYVHFYVNFHVFFFKKKKVCLLVFLINCRNLNDAQNMEHIRPIYTIVSDNLKSLSNTQLWETQQQKQKHHAKQLRTANESNPYAERFTKFKLKGRQEGANWRTSMWRPKSTILMKIHNVLTSRTTVMCNVAHSLHKYWHSQTKFNL